MVRSSHWLPMGERATESRALWDEGSRDPTPSAFSALFQRPMLTLWSASVWPVSASAWPVSVSVWPVLVGPVPAMMGDVKVSVGLRAGCRLTLPTCIEHNGGHGAVAVPPARTPPRMTLTCWLSPAHQPWASVAGSVPVQSGNKSSWNSWTDCGRGDGARWVFPKSHSLCPAAAGAPLDTPRHFQHPDPTTQHPNFSCLKCPAPTAQQHPAGGTQLSASTLQHPNPPCSTRLHKSSTQTLRPTISTQV